MNKENFDKAAATWDENPHRMKLTEAIVNAIKTKVSLDKKMRVLEYGCGTGNISFALAGDVCEIVAADTSSGMIETLKGKLAANPDVKITPVLLLGENGLAEFGNFDLICTGMVMHHVEDIDSTLRLFASLLNPGGVVAIADLYAEDGSFHADMKVPHNGFDPDDLTGKMQAAGFENIRLDGAYIMPRPQEDGSIRNYPIFLARGEKR